MPTDLRAPDHSPSFRFPYGGLFRMVRRVCAAAFGSTALFLSCGILTAEQGTALVPGALGVRNDGTGNTWNIEPDGSIGRVGSTMVNSGLALEVNGDKFTAFQPMMTADGQVIVLQGRAIDSLPGLQVQRRIQILGGTGGLRYAEMFFNGSTDTLSINVALVTNFSGNYKAFFTDRGRTEPVLLGKEESGIVVLPGATQSTRAFLFSLAAESSDVKPTLTARNRYAITVQFPITLAPGESGILLHEVAQTVIPQSFERRRLRALFAPHLLEDAVEEVPDEWRPFLVNGGVPLQGTRELSESGLSRIGIEPQAQDLLVIAGGTRLLGDARADRIELNTAFGRIGLSMDDLLALKGVGPDSEVRAFLRNGEILGGALESDNFRLLQPGGGEVEVRLANSDILVFARAGERNFWEEGVIGLVETYAGDRVAVTGCGDEGIPVATVWGELSLSFDEIEWLGPHSGPAGRFEIRTRNGMRCFGNLVASKVEFASPRWDSIVIGGSEMKSVFTPYSAERKRWGSESIADTVLYLRGGQILIGRPTSPVIVVKTGETTISTEFSRIRSLSRGASESWSGDSIRIERWDGGVIEGIATESFIPILVARERWRIPLRDIERIDTASPELTDEVEKEIEARVVQLGADSWEKREAASGELGAFGYLAAPLLKKHLRITGDPEVRRRLERILSELK